MLESSATVKPSFRSINYIYFVIGRAMANIYDYQISSHFTNKTFVLLKVKEKIFKITATLMLAIKKVFFERIEPFQACF